MFDANSANSIRDLSNALQEDSSPAMQQLLKDLTEELSSQGYLPMVNTLSFSCFVVVQFVDAKLMFIIQCVMLCCFI